MSRRPPCNLRVLREYKRHPKIGLVLTGIQTGIMMNVMTTRRVTANLPGDLLDAAREVTGKGITETIIEGLQQVQRRRFFHRAMKLRGRLKLEVDIEASRGRRRR